MRSCLPAGVDVLLVRARQAADDGHVAIGEDFVANILGDVAHCLEVIRAGDGEARLDVGPKLLTSEDELGK